MKFIFLFFAGLLLFTTPVLAAEVYFGVDNQKMVVGDTFEVGVFLNSENEPVNALEGSIPIPTNLNVEEIRDGNSLVPLWLERPSSDGQQITFSGVIPGGLKSPKAYLFSVIFKAQQGGTVRLAVAKEQILLNDGLGTKASLHEAPLKLSIAGTGPVTHFTPLADSTPPESFQPVLGQGELQENKLFLAFIAHDKDSGIDHYEYYDSNTEYTPVEALQKKWDWQKTESPKTVEKKDLTKYLYVKAVDRAGNATVAVVPPQEGTSISKKVLFYGVVPVMLLGLFVLFWKKQSKKRSIKRNKKW